VFFFPRHYSIQVISKFEEEEELNPMKQKQENNISLLYLHFISILSSARVIIMQHMSLQFVSKTVDLSTTLL
jgi:hypothetical protein